MNHKLYNTLTKLIFALFLLPSLAHAQSDLGVVWQKSDYTTEQSGFSNITKQTDGTYLASGWVISGDKKLGYIVHFNEAGTKLNEYILTPPPEEEWTTGTNSSSNINFAYFTSDGYILAFGLIHNQDVPESLKGYSLGSLPMANNSCLRRGLWVSKIHKTTQTVTVNKLDRNNSFIASSIIHRPDQFLITGFDYQPNQGNNFMYRIYDKDGNWVYDNYSAAGNKLDYEWANQISRLPNNNYSIISAYAVHEYNSTDHTFVKKTFTTLTWGEGCIQEPSSPHAGHLPSGYISSKYDGGYWSSSRMGVKFLDPLTPITLGWAFYEKDSNDQLLDCQVIQGKDVHVAKLYNAPLLLPGSTTDYVGTLSENGINKMYLCKDIAPGFTLIDGTATPYNTSINTTSHTDGFFSCGRDNVTGLAAIAKLSTCVNFKTNDATDIFLPHSSSVSVNRTINYQGAKGNTQSDVKYTLTAKVSKGTVNGKTVGQVLETIPLTQVASHNLVGTSYNGKALTLNRTYTIGATDAEIEYTLRLEDNYLTAGVPQQCSQTYIFKVIVAEKSVFADTVWFFGQNKSGDMTSPGIIFDNYIPTDARDQTKVNSKGTNFSMGVKTCDGYAFYSTYDGVGATGIMYNRKHKPMKNGTFPAPANSTDGYAGAYVGANKYAFFAVSPIGDLDYYLVDMNKDGGNGELIWQKKVSENVTQGIELFPKDGTTNEYWLVYYNTANNELRVELLSGETLTLANTELSPFSGGSAPDVVPVMARSANNNRFACLSATLGGWGGNPYLDIFDFNTATGAISKLSSTSLMPFFTDVYGLSFSPDGEYCAVSWGPGQFGVVSADGTDYQQHIGFTEAGAVGGSGTVPMPSVGGGLKLGPDGIMYQKTNKYVGAIIWSGSNLVDYYESIPTDDQGVNFSIGLTPPSVDPAGINRANTAPVAVNDIVAAYIGVANTISPLANDTDVDGDKLFLSEVSFLNSGDALKASFTVDYDKKQISFTPSTTYAFAEGEKIILKYEIRDSLVLNSMCSEAQIEITIKKLKVESTLFSDDVWFFGQNKNSDICVVPAAGTSKTSKGIIFDQHKVPHDASNISMVNSCERSLSVSTPACNGSFIFYTSHDHVYNSTHLPFEGGDSPITDKGKFEGDCSIADGLSSSYLGDNKYILFSLSDFTQGDLNYYIIDMNQNNGLGQLSGKTLVSAGITEGTELIPKVNTYNEYWLVVYKTLTNNIQVYSVSSAAPYSPSSPNVSLHFELPYSADPIYTMAASGDFTKIAINHSNKVNIDLFDFNPLTGVIAFKKALTTPSIACYGLAFSPNSRFLYASNYSTDVSYQIDLTDYSMISFLRNSTWGGGMKLGPDGKMYIMKSEGTYPGHNTMAVINNPNIKFGQPGGGITPNGFTLNSDAVGVAVSVGLTPPWIDPPTSNTPPVTVDDAVTGTQFDSIRVKPLLNDTDDGSTANLNLSGANFVTATDAALGDLVWRAGTKEVIFTPKSPYPIEKDTVIYLNYITRDQGIPVAMCNEGRIAVTIKYTKVSSTLFSDDVWFFGGNQSGDKTSKGIIFKNGVATDGSGISMVNSYENSLSVSTPACSGFIFYTSHDRVYTSLHKPMKGGTDPNPISNPGKFYGDVSTADGVAAAYIGNNKYILLSVSTFGGAYNAYLYYYIVDMSKDGGLGEIDKGTKLLNDAYVNESIELIPKVGTSNEYWLIFHHLNTGKMRVYSIEGNNGSPIITPAASDNKLVIENGGFSYVLKSNLGIYDKMAMTFQTTGHLYLFDFNPLTGTLALNKMINDRVMLYSVEFSPSGQYLYSTMWRNSIEVYQYDLRNNASYVGKSIYSDIIIANSTVHGGGIKRGSDNKIYITRDKSKYMAVIDKPDLAFTAPGGGATIDGFEMSAGYGGIGISTGLTPPWINPPTSNTPPQAVDDAMMGTQFDSIRVNPLLNDTDDGSTASLNLSGASFVTATDTVLGDLVWRPGTKEVIFAPKNPYPIEKDTVIYLNYVVRDQGIPVAMCDEGRIAVTIKYTKVSSKLFSDDVWFFGLQEGVGSNPDPSTTGTTTSSKGMLFRNDGGVISVQDYSGISKVNSWENTLSVSTPACNGSFIFYASHDHVYNSKHMPIAGGAASNPVTDPGKFNGHTSTADGLASCYIGNNKYLLFAVSSDWNNGNLYYYTVDMAPNDGMGSLSTGTLVAGNNRVSESIELIPKVGTFNEYWLIYHDYALQKLKVIDINGSLANPIGNVVAEIPFNVTAYDKDIVYNIKSNKLYNMFAVAVRNTGTAYLFNFNPTSGQMKAYKNLTKSSIAIYGLEFSANGKYLYAASWKDYNKVTQFDIVAGSIVAESQYTTGSNGGGMKMGPDGKIYIEREGSSWMAVIQNPNIAFTQVGGGVTMDGFKLSRQGNGLGISTGLTPPWIDPVLPSNDAPQAQPDYALTFKGFPVTIQPLLNDSDDGGQANLSITSVSFLNSADATKGTFSLTSGTVVTFTPNASYSFANEEEIILNYIVKDKGIPIQQCDESQIKITIRKSPEIQLTDSCSFKPKLFIDFPISLKIGVDIFLQWEVSSNNASWTTIPGATTTKLEVPTTYLTANNYYRLKVTNLAGVSFYTSTKKLKIINTYILPGGTWYETSLGN